MKVEVCFYSCQVTQELTFSLVGTIGIPKEIEHKPTDMVLPELLPTSHAEYPPSCVFDCIQEGLIDTNSFSDTRGGIAGWRHKVAEEFDPIPETITPVDPALEYTTSVPLVASTSVSAWGTWCTEGLVHTNCGPQMPCPPSSAQTHFQSLVLIDVLDECEENDRDSNTSDGVESDVIIVSVPSLRSSPCLHINSNYPLQDARDGFDIILHHIFQVSSQCSCSPHREVPNSP